MLLEQKERFVMKRKLFIISLIAVLVFSFTACGGSNTSEETLTKDFEGTYEDMGEGTMYISTPSGTSEDGNIPILYEESDTVFDQIGLSTIDMDGSKLSYIFIDGIQSASEQLAETDMTLNLLEDNLTEGVHLVEVVQFENDDTEGAVITYKSAQYEVKIK